MRAWKWFAGGVIAAGLAWGCASTKGKDQATQGDVRAPRSSADAQLASAKSVPASQRLMGNIEPVALFDGPMPTGVAASRQGRIFVNYPKWGDDVDYTVAEIKNGRSIPFPSAEINQYQKGLEADTLVSVQSVVVDPSDRLWIVDTGSIKFGPAMENGPKLYFGGAAQLAAKWGAAAQVLSSSTSRGAAYLDLRIPNKPVAGGLQPRPDNPQPQL